MPRYLTTLTAVTAMVAASLALLAGASDDVMCGFAGAPTSGCSSSAGVVAILVSGVLFLGTGPVAGLLAHRWWAWMTPLWLILAGFAFAAVGGSF